MSLPEWRKEIDRIDEQVLELLNRRAALAQQIGHAKSSARSHYFTPEREHIVFNRLFSLNQGPLDAKAVQAVYREIISACRALEKPLAVAFLGPEGTFSHLASIAKFGSMSSFVPTESIADVFSQVERNVADYGIVPIENSWAGVIPETLDTFMNSNLRVVSEVYQNISHNLLTRAESLEQITKVYSQFQPTGAVPQMAAKPPVPRAGCGSVQHGAGGGTGGCRQRSGRGGYCHHAGGGADEPADPLRAYRR